MLRLMLGALRLYTELKTSRSLLHFAAKMFASLFNLVNSKVVSAKREKNSKSNKVS
jgi:hypothetical protein